jgi:hypothetical protein
MPHHRYLHYFSPHFIVIQLNLFIDSFLDLSSLPFPLLFFEMFIKGNEKTPR